MRVAVSGTGPGGVVTPWLLGWLSLPPFLDGLPGDPLEEGGIVCLEGVMEGQPFRLRSKSVA